MKKPCQRVHVEVPPKRRRIEGVLLCIGGLVPALIVAMGVAVRAEPPVVEDEGRVQAVIDQVEKDCRDRTVYMIGRKKAVRLAELVREARPKRVVECGTAIGYSGLWIARELEKAGGGKLITIELDPERAKEAEANFRRAGLEKFVEVRVGDAKKLAGEVEGPIDFLFIDCGYSNYLPCFQAVQQQLSPGAVVVADNVGIGASSMKPYLDLVRSKYTSRTEWFDLDVPWAKRDAMEVTRVPKE